MHATAEASTPNVPQVQILARRREWNAKGNGPEVTRRVRLPDGWTGWASEAGPLAGGWSNRGRLACERQAIQRVTVPTGTVVVAYTKQFRNGEATGPASVDAGIVGLDEDGKPKIDWGLPVQQQGLKVTVTLPGGKKVDL